MRGEGNHKIPGSFAPENMEKTGAERVKYSLACQHEDAIPIKFVSYAQKCPTVLCTFAVALRKESVDRNAMSRLIRSLLALLICPPRGIVLLNAATLKLWVCPAGCVCLRLLAIRMPVHIIRTFMLCSLSLVGFGCLIMTGGCVAGNWPRGMNLLCLSIFVLLMALNRP